MKKMTKNDLRQIARLHGMWLREEPGGERACLDGADLSGLDLCDFDWSHASLRGVNLSGAYLHRANLSYADLTGANLQGAILRGANMHGSRLFEADLREADLRGANLGDAMLFRADLRGADIQELAAQGPFIKSLMTDQHLVTWTADRMHIGYDCFPIQKWWDMSDDDIADAVCDAFCDAADREAFVEWWDRWKPILQQVLAASPCAPTGAKA